MIAWLKKRVAPLSLTARAWRLRRRASGFVQTEKLSEAEPASSNREQADTNGQRGGGNSQESAAAVVVVVAAAAAKRAQDDTNDQRGSGNSQELSSVAVAVVAVTAAVDSEVITRAHQASPVRYRTYYFQQGEKKRETSFGQNGRKNGDSLHVFPPGRFSRCTPLTEGGLCPAATSYHQSDIECRRQPHTASPIPHAPGSITTRPILIDLGDPSPLLIARYRTSTMVHTPCTPHTKSYAVRYIYTYRTSFSRLHGGYQSSNKVSTGHICQGRALLGAVSHTVRSSHTTPSILCLDRRPSDA